jgi:hypothetical protein
MLRHNVLETEFYLHLQVRPDRDRIQSPKCVLKDKQKDVLDKDMMMDNVQKRNICTNVQTFRSSSIFINHSIDLSIATGYTEFTRLF